MDDIQWKDVDPYLRQLVLSEMEYQLERYDDEIDIVSRLPIETEGLLKSLREGAYAFETAIGALTYEYHDWSDSWKEMSDSLAQLVYSWTWIHLLNISRTNPEGPNLPSLRYPELRRSILGAQDRSKTAMKAAIAFLEGLRKATDE